MENKRKRTTAVTSDPVHKTVILWGPAEDNAITTIAMSTDVISKRFIRLLPVVHRFRYEALAEGKHLDEVDEPSSDQEEDSSVEQDAASFFEEYINIIAGVPSYVRKEGEPVCKPNEIIDAVYLIPMMY